MIVLILLSFVLFVPSWVSADSTSTITPAIADTLGASARPVHPVPGVRVEGSRSPGRAQVPTGFVTELRATSPTRAVTSLADVLSEAAGVRVTQYGGLGAFSTVSIRGAPPGQVAVYLDGAPLSSASHGVVNLADLPVTAVERVEVYRGLSPLGFGTPTPGGAVNLVTVSGVEGARARVAHGTFDTWEAQGTTGASRGAWAALFHAAYQGSRADFPFEDGNATPIDASDDSVSLRVNNAFDALAAVGKVTWEVPGVVRARLAGDLVHREQGFPGRATSPALHATTGFERMIGRLEAETPSAGWRPALRLFGVMGTEELRLHVTEYQLGVGRHDSRDQIDDRSLTLASQWEGLPLGGSFEAVVSRRHERAELNDPADGVPDPPASERRRDGVAAILQLRPWSDRLLLHAGKRWDRLEDALEWTSPLGRPQASEVARTLATPQLGARLAVPFGLELRGNWTDATRAPEFLELFGNQGATQGNPLLLPEQGETWDAGVSWAHEWAGGFRAAAEWAHFETESRDLIVFVRNSPNTSKAQNIARAFVRGQESSLRFSGVAGLSLTASLTLQDSEDRGDIPAWRGKDLPQRPERQLYARLGWAGGRFRLAADVHSIGENFLDRYNLERIDGRTFVGVSGAVEAGAGIGFAAEIKNLTDDLAADVGGYPLPGRSFYLTCRARFGGAASGRGVP